MQTPKSDSKQYRKITLSNGLQVMLISASETEKAAMAMNVQVGSYNDPDDTCGLAHFLEHMLFMGTENYPEEDAYEKFIDRNNGTYNAYTADTRTVYFFDIQHDKLTDILPMFSGFFCNPLMLESAVDREINAVNSEHEKNLQSDAWRGRRLMEHLSNKEHPYSKFGTGNLDTLKKHQTDTELGIRERLVNFYNTYYSSDKMCLSIMGRESLEELQVLVETYFDKVPRRQNVPTLNPVVKPFSDTSQSYKVKTIGDTTEIDLTWYLDNYQAHYKCNPGSYCSSVIGYEGKGSLYSCLKPYGCISLSSGSSTQNTNFSEFCITMEVVKGCPNIEKIVNLCLGYMQIMLQDTEHEDRYNLISRLSRRQFDYSSEPNPIKLVKKMAISMEQFEDEYYLGSLLREYDATVMNKYITQLATSMPLVFVYGRSLEDEHEEKQEKDGGDIQVEPIYGTEYRKMSYPFKAETCSNFSLRETTNPFEPTDLKTKESEAIRLDSSPVHLWFCRTLHTLPKSNVSLSLFNKKFNQDTETHVMLKIYIDMFMDSLNELLYDSSEAGEHAYIYASSYALHFELSGYNDGLLSLLKTLLGITSFTMTKDNFDRQKSSHLAGYEEQLVSAPYKQLLSGIRRKQISALYSTPELIAAANKLTFETITQFSVTFAEMIKESGARMLVSGNETTKTAKEYASEVGSTFELNEPDTLTVPQVDAVPIVQDDTFELSNMEETNIAFGLHYHIGNRNENFRDYCMTILLDEGLSQPFFDSLRTKQQLGYITFCRVCRERDEYGLGFFGQAIEKNFPADTIEKMFKTFVNETAIDVLLHLSTEDYVEICDSLVNQLTQKPKTIRESHGKYGAEICSSDHEPEFDRAIRICNTVRTITIEELVDFYTNTIMKKEGHRLYTTVVQPESSI